LQPQVTADQFQNLSAAIAQLTTVTQNLAVNQDLMQTNIASMMTSVANMQNQLTTLQQTVQALGPTMMGINRRVRLYNQLASE
jgi:ABC-type transporter Mla subunit MlaD